VGSRRGQTDVQMVAIIFWGEWTVRVDGAMPAVCRARFVYFCGERGGQIGLKRGERDVVDLVEVRLHGSGLK